MYDVVIPSALEASRKTYHAIHGYVVYTKSFVARSGATVNRVVLVDPVSSAAKKTPQELARTATAFVTLKAFPALDRILGHNIQLTPVKKEARGAFDSTPNPFVLKPGNGYAVNVKFTDASVATKSKNVHRIQRVEQIPYCPHFTDIADCVNDTCVNVAAILDGVEEGPSGVVARLYDASGCEAKLVVRDGGGGEKEDETARRTACALRGAEQGTVLILLDHMFSSGFDDACAATSGFRRVLKPWGASAMHLGTSSDAVRNRLDGAQRPAARGDATAETLQTISEMPDEEERDERLKRMFGTLTDFLKRKGGIGGRGTVLADITTTTSSSGGGAFVKSRSSSGGDDDLVGQQQQLVFLEEDVGGDRGGEHQHHLLRYDLVTGVNLGFHEGETAVYWSSSAVENVLGMDANTFAKEKAVSERERSTVMEETFAMRRAVMTIWKKDEANLIVLNAFLLPRSTNVLPAPSGSDGEEEESEEEETTSPFGKRGGGGGGKKNQNKRRKIAASSREATPDSFVNHPF